MAESVGAGEEVDSLMCAMIDEDHQIKKRLRDIYWLEIIIVSCNSDRTESETAHPSDKWFGMTFPDGLKFVISTTRWACKCLSSALEWWWTNPMDNMRLC